MLSVILRGGRLTKFKGKAASFAPDTGVSGPDISTGSTYAPVLARVACALGASVSVRTLGSVGLAAGLMLLPGAAHAAPDACTVAGNVVTCTGDQSAGISSGTDFNSPPIDTLNVNNLTQAITPANGDNGINFSNLDALGITINADTGIFGITTAGTDAEGISAFNNNGGNTIITSTGNITTTGSSSEAIFAQVRGGGSLTITSTGIITTAGGNAEGIDAEARDGGNVTITQTGNITTAGEEAYGIGAVTNSGGSINLTFTGNIATAGNDAFGIIADAILGGGGGDVNITGTGNITTAGNDADGINARASLGSINITTTGNITATGNSAYGIIANASDGGNVTVTHTGNVSTLDRGGIDVEASGGGSVTLVQIGDLSTEGSFDFGIDADTLDGGSITVTQTGTVTTLGAGSDGISAYAYDGGSVTVVQTGTITTQGVGAEGIQAEAIGGDDVSVTQTGSISTEGDSAEGIRANARNGGNTTVIHTGTITTQGVGAEGLEADIDSGGGSVTVTTNSTITALAAAGVQVDNDGTGTTTITTAGVVSGTTGIDILSRNNNVPTTINNSAAITGTGGFAINFQGDGNDTLNLNGGSVINGAIDFGNGNDGLGGTNPNDIDTLNVGPGVNAVLTFADASGGDSALASAPENITGNVALINGGTQAVAVDPTGFAAVSTALGSLISSIFNSIDNNKDGSPATAVPAGGTARVIPASGDIAYGGGRRLWVSGFGGKQKVEGSSSQIEIDNRFGGSMTGVESGSGGSTYGVFGGYGVSKLDLEFGAGDLEFDSAFGGAYWKINTGTLNVNLAILAGSADQDTTRNVGGVNARGESDGWFIAPSITVAAPMEFYAQPVIFSARVSYAGLFLDGYTETGVANPLTVDDRDVHILNTRAQINVPYTMAGKDGSQTRMDLRIGADAQFDVGSDNAALVVGGTPLSFSTRLDDEIAGFVGTTVNFTSASGMFSFSASGEIQSTFDGGYEAVGEVRGAVRF